MNTSPKEITPVSVSRSASKHVWLVAVVAALVSAVFFGLNAVASKLLFSPAAPAHFDAVSLFVARGFWSLPLFLVLAFVTKPRSLPSLTWKNACLFALCGITYGPGTNALSALGASETSAGHAVLLLSLFPPLAAVLASLFLQERLAALRVVAILIGVFGALILTLSKSGAGSSVAGDAMIGAFILTWAVLTLGIRKLDSTYPPLFVVGVFGTLGCLLLTGMGLITGRIDAILIPLKHYDAATIIWFDVELVLLLSLVGQLLQGVALRTLNVALVVALTSYGSIAAGLAASIVLLGEHLTVGEIVAGLFLVTALALSLVPISAPSRIFHTPRQNVAAALYFPAKAAYSQGGVVENEVPLDMHLEVTARGICTADADLQSADTNETVTQCSENRRRILAATRSASRSGRRSSWSWWSSTVRFAN
jgi:drug/metabolite transporter (DMT)-like permease